MGKIAITYRKSGIGYRQSQKDTLRKLGLKRMHQTVTHDDTPAIRGMVAKVSHLVEVSEEGSK